MYIHYQYAEKACVMPIHIKWIGDGLGVTRTKAAFNSNKTDLTFIVGNSNINTVHSISAKCVA